MIASSDFMITVSKGTFDTHIILLNIDQGFEDRQLSETRPEKPDSQKNLGTGKLLNKIKYDDKRLYLNLQMLFTR